MSSRSIEQLMRDAEALVAEVERSLSSSQGLALEKFPQVSSQQQDYVMRQAQDLVEQDLQDIERQLGQEQGGAEIPATASSSLVPRAGTVKRHIMI